MSMTSFFFVPSDLNDDKEQILKNFTSIFLVVADKYNGLTNSTDNESYYYDWVITI